MPFQIIRADITKVKADIIVNTANPKPICASGTDLAIYEAAGMKKLLKEREKIGDIACGEAAVTPAFKLPAKYIIHTVGPAWQGGNHNEFENLRSCYEKSLKLAVKLKAKSIAFPLIATGVYGFPKDKALNVALSVIQPFVLEHEIKVFLVVFDRGSFELSGNLVENIREYVDSNYVEEAKEREYGLNYSMINNASYGRAKSSAPVRFERMAEMAMPEPAFAVGGINITPDKTFQQKLFEIIDSRGLTGPEVYKNYISKQVYSKIQADVNYHPNKFTAIALCLSLHLDINETTDMLERAGWALSPSNKADLVVKACILNKEYNLAFINCILFDYNCPELEKIK